MFLCAALGPDVWAIWAARWSSRRDGWAAWLAGGARVKPGRGLLLPGGGARPYHSAGPPASVRRKCANAAARSAGNGDSASKAAPAASRSETRLRGHGHPLQTNTEARPCVWTHGGSHGETSYDTVAHFLQHNSEDWRHD